MDNTLFIVIALVVTLLATAVTGLIFAIRNRHTSFDDFITARGSTGFFTSFATVTASIMGGWILFSPAEAATWAGITGVIGYGVAQALPLFMYAILGPRIRTLSPYGHSLSEFVSLRYGRLMHIMVLGFILLYLVVFLGAEMGAIARAILLVSDIPILPTILAVAVVTLIYTAYGGIRTSIFTDKLQFIIFIPLISVLVIATIFALGGWERAFEPVRINNPQLLNLNHRPGVELAITFAIGIFAANMFHQGFWQRVYAAKNSKTLRLSFFSSGLLVILLVIVCGLFGLWAVSRGLISEDSPASIALFSLALEILPAWLIIVLAVAALLLVMSSLDTLLNSIVSVLSVDLPRIGMKFTSTQLLKSARYLTALTAVPAILIGYFFDSVLYPFLIADMVCAAGVVPVFLGMFSSKFGAKGGFISTTLGLIAGAIFFPTPSFQGWWTFTPLSNIWDILVSGNLLASFIMALVVSTLSASVFLLANKAKNKEGYDFKKLTKHTISQ